MMISSVNKLVVIISPSVETPWKLSFRSGVTFAVDTYVLAGLYIPYTIIFGCCSSDINPNHTNDLRKPHTKCQSDLGLTFLAIVPLSATFGSLGPLGPLGIHSLNCL